MKLKISGIVDNREMCAVSVMIHVYGHAANVGSFRILPAAVGFRIPLDRDSRDRFGMIAALSLPVEFSVPLDMVAIDRVEVIKSPGVICTWKITVVEDSP